MIMPEISVIIPFYNTSFTLIRNCIQSLVNQTFDKFEAIIIDDGSLKEYADFIDNECKNLDFTKVYHINNEGVSYARNYGMSLARGNYICFVDSDDYLASWALEDLLKGIELYDADISISYLKKVDSLNYKFLRNIEFQCLNMNEINSREYINEVILRGLNIEENDKGYLSCGPCAILLKKEIALSYVFPIGIRYMEDVIWNYNVFNASNRITKINETTYAYVNNDSSATRIFDRRVIEDRIISLTKIAEMVNKNPQEEQWYALRLLSNISIICYQYGHVSSIRHLTRSIKDAYSFSYRKEWDVLNRKNIGKKWEAKYKVKLYLYRFRTLPLIMVIRQFIYELRHKK